TGSDVELDALGLRPRGGPGPVLDQKLERPILERADRELEDEHGPAGGRRERGAPGVGDARSVAETARPVGEDVAAAYRQRVEPVALVVLDGERRLRRAESVPIVADREEQAVQREPGPSLGPRVVPMILGVAEVELARDVDVVR